MTKSEREYPVPFDILDAAVDCCLSRYTYAPHWVEFQRQRKTSGSVVYQLWREDLGDVGTVTVRKTGPEKTRLEVGDPPMQTRDPTPEELAQIRAIADLEAKRKARASLTAKVLQEALDLNHRRNEHQRLVIQDLLYKLDEEPCLPGTSAKSADETRQTAEKRKDKRGKRSRYSQEERDDIVKAWESLDREATPQILEDFLSERIGMNYENLKPLVAPSTFYGWRRHFLNRNPDWQPDKP